jgi:hypothetical protein
VAWVTSAHGPEVYRRTLASAAERLQSGVEGVLQTHRTARVGGCACQPP